MRVSYDKDTRKEAVKNDKRLYTFHLSGPGGKGGITCQGLFGPNTLKEIKGYVDAVFSVLKGKNNE